MQVTATAPRFVRREEIPAEQLASQRALFAADLEGKPAAAVEGKLDKWIQEVVLLEQPFIRDESKRVGDLVTDAVAKVGENIQVRRFARFATGE
jgi:elongation factor Ts